MKRNNEPQSLATNVMRSMAMAALMAWAGCASGTPNTGGGGGGGGTADLSMPCTTQKCTDPNYCEADGDCTKDKNLTHCDTTKHDCVGCTKDADCDPGKLCNPTNHTCSTGCSNSHGCAADAGVCEADAGLCVECQADPDCTADPNKTRCDGIQHRCFPCNPSGDNCGHALYCALQQGDFSCSAGCKDDTDCNPLLMPMPDMAMGMGGKDGGAADGGGMMSDGGKSMDMSVPVDLAMTPADMAMKPDMAMPKPNAMMYCNKAAHACVQCIADDNCPLGKVCKANQCVPGCSNMHGCDQMLACCGAPGSQSCVDTTSDFQNCGGCGNQCQGGWNCCNSGCSNPLIDVMNCGMCGNTCMVANGTPTCVQRSCAIAKCNQGWNDCNGVYMDGCETNTDQNVNNCGACNNACTLPNALPKCVGGTCQVGSCLPGTANCDGNAMNGCETVTTNDPMNCGGCNMKCSGNHISQPTCGNSTCNGMCDLGFTDCDGNKLTNGCEIDTQNDVANCGGCNTKCGTQCMGNVTTTTCGKGVCSISACAAGYYDIDQSCANGCECKANPVGGKTCGAAAVLGAIAIGGAPINVQANLVGPNTDAWYQVQFGYVDKTITYHPSVAFSVNPSNAFLFDVYYSCNPLNPVSCTGQNASGGGDNNPSSARIAWEIFYQPPAVGPTFDIASPGYIPVPPVGTGGNGVVFIHVFRNPLVTKITCDPYTIHVSNG